MFRRILFDDSLFNAPVEKLLQLREVVAFSLLRWV